MQREKPRLFHLGIDVEGVAVAIYGYAAVIVVHGHHAVHQFITPRPIEFLYRKSQWAGQHTADILVSDANQLQHGIPRYRVCWIWLTRETYIAIDDARLRSGRRHAVIWQFEQPTILHLSLRRKDRARGGTFRHEILWIVNRLVSDAIRRNLRLDVDDRLTNDGTDINRVTIAVGGITLNQSTIIQRQKRKHRLLERQPCVIIARINHRLLRFIASRFGCRCSGFDDRCGYLADIGAGGIRCGG